MLVYQVEDMTCGHCAATITRAVRGVDDNARVQVDLAQRRVAIEATDAEAEDFLEAITQAGYSSVQVTAAPSASGPEPKAS
ncbi:MAG: heavy-metal-associated domain-containing protein [Pelomonas sp.]|nr:heavy-metal-associated domain-containing protein [Roseateles sp.]